MVTMVAMVTIATIEAIETIAAIVTIKHKVCELSQTRNMAISSRFND